MNIIGTGTASTANCTWAASTPKTFSSSTMHTDSIYSRLVSSVKTHPMVSISLLPVTKIHQVLLQTVYTQTTTLIGVRKMKHTGVRHATILWDSRLPLLSSLSMRWQTFHSNVGKPSPVMLISGKLMWWACGVAQELVKERLPISFSRMARSLNQRLACWLIQTWPAIRKSLTLNSERCKTNQWEIVTT